MSFCDDDDDDALGLRFCLVGPSRVGKTAIMNALVEKPFQEKFFSTNKVSAGLVTIKVKGKDVAVTIMDGPGPLELITASQWLDLVEDCDGVIYVFDVTNKTSLTELEAYTRKVYATNPDAKTILVGNKVDDIVYQEVEDSLGVQQAQLFQCDGGYMEASAKKYKGISEVIIRLSSSCLGMEEVDFASPRSNVSSGTFDPFSISATSMKNLSGVSLLTRSTSGGKGKRLSMGRRGSITKSDEIFCEIAIPQFESLGQWYLPLGERDDFLLKVRDSFSKGVKLLQYPHGGGAPAYAILTFNYPYTSFTFTKDNGQKEIIIIDDISEIRPHSEQSYTFKCMNIPRACEGKDHLFTIIASEKSISLAALSSEECLFLVRGLKLILECAIPLNVKKSRGKDAFSTEKLLKIIKYCRRNDDADFVDRLKFKLKQGIDVSYVRRNGKHKERILSLDATDSRLVFLRRRVDDIAVQLSVIDSLLMYFEGPDPGMDIEDIAEIRPGYASANFAKIEPPPDPSQEHLALSFVSSERTISIIMKNERDCDFITSDVLVWLHSIRMSSTMY